MVGLKGSHFLFWHLQVIFSLKMSQLIPRMFLANYLHLHRDESAVIIGLGLEALIMKTEILIGLHPDSEGRRGLDLDQILVQVGFNIIS